MLKILAVDSSPDMLILFTKIFKADNILVEGCNSIDDMLVKLAEVVPDLLVLDAMIKGLDERMVSQLRSMPALSNVPVLVTSSKKIHAGMYEVLGADAAIEKPFHTHEIRDKVRSLLSRQNSDAD